MSKNRKLLTSNPWKIFSFVLLFFIGLLAIYVINMKYIYSENPLVVYSPQNLMSAIKCSQSGGEWHFKDVTRVPDNGLMVLITEKKRGCTCPEGTLLENDRCAPHKAPDIVDQNLEERCNRRVEPGACMACRYVYYFNHATGKCEETCHGGCRDGYIPFTSLDECQITCENKF